MIRRLRTPDRPHRAGGCLRCGRSWRRRRNLDLAHLTPYWPPASDRRFAMHSCFVLCEPCWSSLTVDERLPWYTALWVSWLRDGGADRALTDELLDRWPAIAASVEAGG